MVLFVDIVCDGVNKAPEMYHTALLRKLLSAGLPMYLLRLIVFWYCNQFYHVRWGNALSVGFTVLLMVLDSEECSPLYFLTFI